jgi:predicted esterase
LALTAVLAAGWWLHQRGRVRWARAEAIPEIRRLMAADRGAAALELAREARRWIPEDAELRMLWPEVALSPFIETEPPGAEVSYQDLASTNGIWHYAGRTPITNAVFPRGYFRWRATRDGYGEAVGAAGSWSGRIRLMLPPAEGAPVGMVLVPKPPAGTPGVSWVRDVGGINEGFFIDRHEVTNREFKRFVDAGGYEKREFWKHEFKRDGMPQTWEQAVGQFRDVTGRPGPATWEGGGYPEKQDDFPVRGVSWYEAAAYAAFAGKSLPTVAHWYHTADLWSSPLVVPRSNFGGNGPAPVGSFPSLGAFGTYDMAGNVAEWCWNETEGGLRFILGGAWGSPSYLFGEAEAKSPWDRGPKNGFRCARYPNPLPETLTQAKVRPRRDFTKELPVGDEAFRLLRAAYAYETKELKPEIEGTDDDSPYWTKQRVSIEAAYGQDRLPVLLFLPKSAKPPYQTVVFYPGSNAYGGTYDRLAGFERVDFIIRSGRALVYPIYRGMYDRRLPTATGQRDSRDRLVNTYQDMGRAIDYVVGRPEFDRDRLAFLGISLGAWRGAQMLALEGRFKTAVLMEGGMLSFAPQFPEVDPLHFLPRVRIPVLMLNGRYDFLFPFETSQKPFFQTLGTPNADKRHVVFDSAHDVMIFRTDVMREMLTWLETYLGPIRR